VSEERDRVQEAAPQPVVEPGVAAPAAAPGLGPLGSGMSPTTVLALQRSAGNEAVTRALSGGRAPLGVSRDFFGSVFGDETADAQKALEEFRKQPCAPLVNHKPSSGLGQFDVTADMAAGTMTVTLKVAYNFVDGNAASVPKGFRPEEFKWKEDEKTTWKAQYQKDVSELWSAKFQAKSTEKHWESMVVDITVSVVEDAAPHFTLTVAKYPPDAAMVQSSICPPGYHHDAASGNCAANAAGDGTGTAALDSNDMRPEQKLDWGNASSAINFPEGGSTLDGAAKTALDPIVTALKGHPEAHVELTGRASSTHRRGDSADDGAIRNMDLARKRTAVVQQALLDAGATGDQILVRNEGENNAADGKEWCRVDAQVGTKQTQDPALHETGHMLGNEDEYTGTGSAAGSAMPAKFDAMVKAQTGDVVTHVDDASVMSMGSTVRRWNYSAFVEALKDISKKQEWSL
jgi:outer membrane protein OmpA-like peptidoglycan-associated protein